MGYRPSAAAAAGDEPEHRYWAFISHSHRDERWARWLHNSLGTCPYPPSRCGTGPRCGRIAHPNGCSQSFATVTN